MGFVTPLTPFRPQGFKQRRMNFLTELLARKWECEKPGHSVCLCTSDGQHHLVSEMGVATWVDALYEGRATTLQPPVDVLAPTVKRVHLSDGSSTLRIIPFVPSRRRTRLHILARSASFRERLESTVLFSSLPPSSGIPGIGYYSGKGIKWLGERSLDAMDDLIIFKRTLQYLIWLDEREKEVVRLSPTIQLAVGNNTEKKVFNILEDALEMSRICYPKSVNACAETLGWKLIDWMDSAAALSLTEGTATLFSQIHCCLSILHLAQDIRKDLCESELAEELLDALTRVPLTLQGKETVSVVISLLAKELAFAPYSSNHRWLGYHLSCIINRTVRVRPLTLVELGVIRDIALRRLIQ
ncbi:hypothetical protein K439DRAFT_597079 [Ramaria rubella]|nr:hypothetical protein K439DRAFT_597079 [Ramaria rubella]